MRLVEELLEVNVVDAQVVPADVAVSPAMKVVGRFFLNIEAAWRVDF